ncbi:MAG: hypothetical protein U0R49_07105 [Fimbriimonadales bacterium]
MTKSRLVSLTAMVLSAAVICASCRNRSEASQLASRFENYGRMVGLGWSDEHYKRMMADNEEVRTQTLAFLLFTTLWESSSIETVPLTARMSVIYPLKGFYETEEFRAFRRGALSRARPATKWLEPAPGSRAEKVWQEEKQLVGRVAKGDTKVVEAIPKLQEWVNSKDPDACAAGAKGLVGVLMSRPDEKERVIRILAGASDKQGEQRLKSMLTEVSVLLKEFKVQKK